MAGLNPARAFFYFITLTRILFYIISFSYDIQSALVDQLVKALVGKCWDLGSNPRSPHFISIVLFKLFQCSTRSKSSPCTQYQDLPSVLREAPEDQTKGLDLKHTISLVNHPTRCLEKSMDLKDIGLNLLGPHLLIGA